MNLTKITNFHVFFYAKAPQHFFIPVQKELSTNRFATIIILLWQKPQKSRKLVSIHEFFAQHNVKFVFSGHIHSQDVASYEGSNGKTIYDISTGSLTTYPCPYRNITLTDEEMVIKTEYIEDIDTSKLSTIHIKPEALAHAERDFKDYAKTCLDTGFESQLYFLLCHRGIVQNLGFNEETEPELYEKVINFSSKLYDVMKLPLYEKDAEEGATSLEALAKEYGTYLAKSDYKDLMSLLTEIYNCNSLGDHWVMKAIILTALKLSFSQQHLQLQSTILLRDIQLKNMLFL